MTERILIRGGIVLTQDPELGELANADVLVEDDRIAAVGPNLSADGARVIDAGGDIVIPGFIDTHRHTWETCIRTCAPDFALITYFGSILDKFAPHYRPEDVHSATLWGSLECLNAGITTLVDWAHIMNTPAHADESVQALEESGIRSVFAYGFPNTSLVDWWFGPDYAGSVLPRTATRRGGCGRSTSAPTTAASRWASPPADPASASPMSCATTGSSPRSWASTSPCTSRWTDSGIRRARSPRLRDMDLLYPGTTYVHASHFTDEEWGLVRDSGGNVSSRRRSRSRWATAGHRPSPPRTTTCRSASPPTWPRPHPPTSSRRCTRLRSERGRKHQEAWDAGLDGLEASPGLITSRQVLRGQRWVAPRSRGSPTGPARSRPARRPTSSSSTEGGERRTGHRSGRRGRLRRGHLERADGPGRRPGGEGRLQALGRVGRPRRVVEASRDYLVGKFGEPEPGWLPSEGGGRLREFAPTHREDARVSHAVGRGPALFSRSEPREPCQADRR